MQIESCQESHSCTAAPRQSCRRKWRSRLTLARCTSCLVSAGLRRVAGLACGTGGIDIPHEPLPYCGTPLAVVRSKTHEQLPNADATISRFLSDRFRDSPLRLPRLQLRGVESWRSSIPPEIASSTAANGQLSRSSPPAPRRALSCRHEILVQRQCSDRLPARPLASSGDGGAASRG